MHGEDNGSTIRGVFVRGNALCEVKPVIPRRVVYGQIQGPKVRCGGSAVGAREDLRVPSERGIIHGVNDNHSCPEWNPAPR
jgi:hypothetical protein